MNDIYSPSRFFKPTVYDFIATDTKGEIFTGHEKYKTFSCNYCER